MNRGLLVLLPALLVAGSPKVQMRPGFDPQGVVRRVSHASTRAPIPGPRPLAPEVDDGEFLVDTSMVFRPAPGDQNFSAVAFDGTNFLVVWQDAGVYGARVTPAGLVLDPAGIIILQTTNDQECPALAFDGTDFLVVWQDDRSGNWDIYGARVTPAGTVLDPDGIVISPAADNQWSPAVASDGLNSLVVWADRRNGSDCDIYGARVTPAGLVLDPDGFVISQPNGQWSPALAFDGTNFLVAWDDWRNGSDIDIYGARVTPAGLVLDPDGIAITQASHDQQYPALASDGTNFLVAWEDYRSSGVSDIYGARVTPAGLVLDSNGIAISQASSYQEYAALAFNGTDFLVVWDDWRGSEIDIYGARVTPRGLVRDPDGIVISHAANHRYNPALASDGLNSLVVWDDWRSYNDNIYGARVTPRGFVLDPNGIVISQTANDQRNPTLAFDGLNFLVVWDDSRTGSDGIRGARVTPQGLVLDPEGFVISPAAGFQWSPALAFDGANFLVVWEDHRSGPDIYCARVTPQGVVLDPDGIVISQAANGQEYPAVAFDGTSFLVVWLDFRSSDYPDIYGARVTPRGRVLDPDGIAISQAADWQGYPALAFDGANFLVAWDDGRGSSYDIYGARVTPAGLVLDSGGIAISQTAHDQYHPALGFDGTDFLVVWDDYRGGSDDIYGARVTPAGLVLDPDGIAIAQAADDRLAPALAFDGANYLVAWTGGRSGDSSDICGAWVSPAGTVSGEGAVVRQARDQQSPALFRGSGSQMLLVYQGWAGTVGDRVYNANRIWGKLDPHPGIEETMNDERGTLNLGPTIVRGVLDMPLAAFHDGKPGQSTTGQSLVFLLDISGRKVLALHPGPNDVSGLAPGVYFVRGQGSGVGGQEEVRKVVIQR
jgi:phosphoribosylformylglycinamidine (FGAM) synthase PurS component